MPVADFFAVVLRIELVLRLIHVDGGFELADLLAAAAEDFERWVFSGPVLAHDADPLDLFAVVAFDELADTGFAELALD